MKPSQWNEGLNLLDSELVEGYIIQKDELLQKKKAKTLWLRVSAVAACLALVVSAVIIPMMQADSDAPSLPTVNSQISSPAPQYFGSQASEGSSVNNYISVSSFGLSVTAELVETLPDTYTFFDDWHQYAFRILRMKTVKLLSGQEMTEEFYYLIPVDFMTDFSLYDRFVIINMAQFGYEYSVVYNKTQGKAEQLNLVLFGYNAVGHYLMGENFMAFNSLGLWDARLWKSNDAWRTITEKSKTVYTIGQAETKARNSALNYDHLLYVHLLEDITGEAAEVLSQIKSFENGLFVPVSSSGTLQLSPEVQFHAVRYINGFATNERISIWSKEWDGSEVDTYSHTKAQFSEDDLNVLPDLNSAIAAVASAYDSGQIVPPHIVNYEELGPALHGIFGWYAMTPDGVIGIVRVTWDYFLSEELDDAYYFIEYGSAECKPIDRDALLQKLGEYESTYIYTGVYDERGKERNY